MGISKHDTSHKFATGKKAEMAIQARQFWFTGLGYFKKDCQRQFDGGEFVGFSVAPSNRVPDHYSASVMYRPSTPGRTTQRPWSLLHGWLEECERIEHRTFGADSTMTVGEERRCSTPDPETGVVTISQSFAFVPGADSE